MAFTRSEGAIIRGSAQLTDYLRPASATWQSRWFPLKPEGNQRLLPGLSLTLLVLAGGVLGLRQHHHRRWTIFLALSLSLALLLSFGLNLKLGSWQP